jgi:hypothetical protein
MEMEVEAVGNGEARAGWQKLRMSEPVRSEE